MKRLSKEAIPICILACLFLLTACGQPVAEAAGVVSLQVARSSAVPDNTFPAFTRTIHNQAQATQLYNAIQQLPRQQIVFCPLDNGLQYNLIFTQPGGKQVHILLSASGCKSAILAPNDRRATNDAFWSMVAQTIGLTKNDIFVKPA